MVGRGFFAGLDTTSTLKYTCRKQQYTATEARCYPEGGGAISKAAQKKLATRTLKQCRSLGVQGFRIGCSKLRVQGLGRDARNDGS